MKPAKFTDLARLHDACSNTQDTHHGRNAEALRRDSHASHKAYTLRLDNWPKLDVSRGSPRTTPYCPKVYRNHTYAAWFDRKQTSYLLTLGYSLYLSTISGTAREGFDNILKS